MVKRIPDFRTKPLEDFCSAIIDCPHSTPSWLENGKLVLRNFNLKNGQIDLSDPSYTDEKTFKLRNARVKPEPGDLAISREAPMGEVAMIPEEIECCLGQRMVLLRPNTEICDTHYLLYALLSEYVQTQIKRNDTSGSIVSNLCIPDLAALRIPDYDLEAQRKIGATLSTIDDKIANNKKLMNELEKTARLIYDYWFTQFDFPDGRGKPYRSSGGEMVWTEELKQEIPKGWSFSKLGSIVSVIRGVTYDASDAYDDANEGLTLLFRANNIGNGTINFDSVVYVNSNCVGSNQMLSRGSIFICMSSGSKQHVGKTAIVPYDMDAAFGAFCSKIEAIEDYRAYADMYIRSKEFDAIIKQRSLGTNINNITSGMITELALPLPPVELSRRFNKVLTPFLDMYEALFRETQELQSLRDWLLPMLMNGQATIED